MHHEHANGKPLQLREANRTHKVRSLSEGHGFSPAVDRHPKSHAEKPARMRGPSGQQE